MIRENEKLDHKNPDDDRNQVVLIKFNGDDQGHRQKNIPEEYGNKGQEEGFIFRFSDSMGKGFTHNYEIDNTKNCSENQPLANGCLTGKN